jgi:hypothetical protein
MCLLDYPLQCVSHSSVRFSMPLLESWIEDWQDLTLKGGRSHKRGEACISLSPSFSLRVILSRRAINKISLPICDDLLSLFDFGLTLHEHPLESTMGSIEGVIILSPTNEPILHSHFLHPLANYPILHADQLTEKLEASTPENAVLPISYTDKIPSLPIEGNEDDDDKHDDGERIQQNGQEDTGNSCNSARSGSALVHTQHDRLRFVATFSRHGKCSLRHYMLACS